MLIERISEWTHFLNLAKGFWRYSNFSAPKNGVFLDKTEGTYLSEMAPKKKIFEVFFAIFWE